MSEQTCLERNHSQQLSFRESLWERLESITFGVKPFDPLRLTLFIPDLKVSPWRWLRGLRDGRPSARTRNQIPRAQSRVSVNPVLLGQKAKRRLEDS